MTRHHDHTSAPHAHSHAHGGHDMDWERMAPLLERGAELNSTLYRDAAHWLAGQLPAAAVRRVLDIGSGPGVLTVLLAEVFPYAEVVAVDATPELLERAADRAARAGIGDRFRAVRAELPDGLGALGTADLIWAGDSVHHIGDQRAMLDGLAGLLRPGGLLALVEGGLPTRHLPRDIGLGRPGLEARIDAVQSDWFTKMRAELPGAKEEVEDWRALLTAAGLTDSRTRSFLLDLPAPLPEAAREHVTAVFARRREAADGRLADDDIAVLDRLLDPADPHALARRADLHLLTARTVHTGRRA
ncbi:class I SAM-dependent methyltransferase [Streptomyces qinzhouensis]|uniref:Methyltransferase domain-containing protein n=1 Tax=Streptomyces qinzhouensis TaxID=2599401 RepID=A0A5B8JQ55_9ACTN|nr:class I SAM-dependent methyltransferase [Streptomyces qinzhouensis]QDY79853.1 methyltransferase domain-containing protein [Streptomyces qinzhouensis]